jgi:small subunit ribosomal protein S1
MEERNDPFEQPAEEEKTVEESTNSQESMESLLEKEGLGLDFPKTGETRTGVIASISESEILVSVGAKSEGIISGREFDQIDFELRSELKVGTEIPVYVLSLEDKNGNLSLSYNRALEEMDWDFAEKLQESDEVYESKVVGFNKGGLIIEMGQLRGFVPASQIGLSRRMTISGDTPEKRYSKIVGELISVRVIEVDRTRRRLILSERMALKETRETLKERLLEDLQVGDIRTGRVTSLADFGAFVNIDGADGLVHLSEISWERIQSPKEVLKVGQEVQVQVISIDRERKRIGLSLRRLQDNPWLKKVENLREGQLIEGTITHLTKFGAFAKLGDEDLEGLIHVSELSASRVEHPKEILSEGETLTLRVIKIDKDRQRIGLSLRKVDSAAYADLDWKMLREELDAVAEGILEVGAEGEEPVEEGAPEAEEVKEDLELEPESAAFEIEEAETEPEVEPEEAEAEPEGETEPVEAAAELEVAEPEREEAESEPEDEPEIAEAAAELEVAEPEREEAESEPEGETKPVEAAAELEIVESESEEEAEEPPLEEEPALEDDPEPDEDPKDE